MLIINALKYIIILVVEIQFGNEKAEKIDE